METEARIRLQSEAGVRSAGQLVFGYNSVNERVEIQYVRVTKPDGEVVVAGPEAVQDLSSPVSQEAPMYSDLRQKHVTVPGLSVGDILEYDVATITFKAFANGQFWGIWNFTSDKICLDEQLELNVPGDRLLRVKDPPTFASIIREEGDRRIYRWKSSNLKIPPVVNPFANLQILDLTKILKGLPTNPPLRAMYSTFQTWDQVGKWYADLESDRKNPTVEVRAKADEIVKGATSDLAKAEAIYGYVSRNVRYVSLSFGVGRYQPHAANLVLSNQYGDCKDKATLLDSLLEAEGILGSTVLISSQVDADRDFPSPQQFDHAISFVSLAGKDYWLDSTTGIAPFNYLPPQLRGKNGLLVISDQEAILRKTPENITIPTLYKLDLQMKDSPGKMDAQVTMDIRGEAEVLLRTMVLQFPAEQLNSMMNAGAKSAGNISDASITNLKTSDPFDIQNPFHIEAHITSNLPSLNHQIPLLSDLPLDFSSLGFVLPDPPNSGKEADQKLVLGGPKEFILLIKVPIPAGVDLPRLKPFHISREFADFDSTASLNDRVLTAEWHLNIRARELLGTQIHAYSLFRGEIFNNRMPFAMDVSKASGTSTGPSSFSDVQSLYKSGVQSIEAGDFKKAQRDLEKVVAMAPRWDNAWNDLGRAYAGLGQLEKAVEAFRKCIEINPKGSYAQNNLGLALWRQQKLSDAIEAFRKQIEITPDDRFAHANLGQVYYLEEKYDLAASELEKGASLNPSSAAVRMNLGLTYLKLKEMDKATSAFEKTVELSPNPLTWNNVAYSMSDNDIQLDRAKDLAELAVNSTEALLRNTSLDHLTDGSLSEVATLAHYWDTLGWVKFKQGDFPAAEKYIRASWELEGDSIVGDHLAQILEKEGRKAEAIHIYELSLTYINPSKGARQRLAALVGGDEKVNNLVESVRSQPLEHQTIRFKNGRKVHGKAEFWILLVPGPKVEAVRLINGSDDLKVFAEELRAASYPNMFPDATETKIVRRGELDCSPYGTECIFVMVPPSTVQIAN